MSLTLARNDRVVTSDIDPFSPEFLSDPYRFHEQLREAGPVVRLTCYDVWAVARYEQAHAMLSDWQTFGSGGGVGISNFHKEANWRPPSLLLETDPPMHTRARTVMNRVLSPANLRRLRDGFYRDAVRLLDRALEQRSFDAVAELAQPYPLKVFPDAVGIAEDERQKLLAYGDMVFNTMGPKNERYQAAMSRAAEVIPWVMQRCERAALRPDSLGAEVYRAADAGEVTHAEAALLVRSFLSAGVDTTIYALGNAVLCFAEDPEQWQRLRQDPTKVRAAFDEVMRFETPFQAFFRTTTHATEIAGVPIDSEEKIYISVGSANRDPRRWDQAARFDIARKATGHVGFGTGIHGCVGQMIARLEVEMMLTAMVERVASIEISGKPDRLLHNTLRAVTKLPVQMTRAP
jgi:4-methoxybenzoate monooxygenase (O-demethylating)